MKTAILAILLLLAVPPAFAQGAPPQGSADQPYVMEFYYKVQWGHQKEFLDLFLKNHFPILQEIQKSGRIVARRRASAGCRRCAAAAGKGRDRPRRAGASAPCRVGAQLS